jgi:hypothetical protein
MPETASPFCFLKMDFAEEGASGHDFSRADKANEM